MNDELYEARLIAGFSVSAAANLIGIPRQTWKLWGYGKLKTPPYVLELMQVRCGYLPDRAVKTRSSAL